MIKLPFEVTSQTYKAQKLKLTNFNMVQNPWAAALEGTVSIMGQNNVRAMVTYQGELSSRRRIMRYPSITFKLKLLYSFLLVFYWRQN